MGVDAKDAETQTEHPRVIDWAPLGPRYQYAANYPNSPYSSPKSMSPATVGSPVLTQRLIEQATNLYQAPPISIFV